MAVQEFTAQIVNGKLDYSDKLDAWEGKKVTVTLNDGEPIIRDANYDPLIYIPPFMSQEEYEQADDLPEDLEVERDVYIPMPIKYTRLENVTIVDEGRMKPCIILPEEIADE